MNKIFTIILFFFAGSIVFAQNISSVSVNLSGEYSVSSKKSVREFSEGYYRLDFSPSIIFNSGVCYEKEIYNGWGFYVGGSIRGYRNKIEYFLVNPFTFESHDNPLIFLNYLSLGIKTGIFFEVKKFRFKVASKFNNTIGVKSSRSPFDLRLIVFFYPENQENRSIVIREEFNNSKTFLDYYSPELIIEYKVRGNLFLTSGIKFNSLGNEYQLFRVHITGNMQTQGGVQEVLNDTKVYSNYTAVSLGLKYQFDFIPK